MSHYLNNVLRVSSRWINTVFFGGYPTETVSGRCYEEDLIWVVVLDFIFGQNHCYESWLIDSFHQDSRYGRIRHQED